MSQQLEAQGLDAAEWRELQRLMRQACARLDALAPQSSPDEPGSPGLTRSGPASASATADLDAALAALDVHVNALLATAARAAQAAQDQGGEIDALLAEIRDIRALAVAA